MKRVLMIDADWPDPRRDAGSAHLAQIAAAFARLGYQVEVAVAGDGAEPCGAFPAQPRRRDAATWLADRMTPTYDTIVLCRPEVAEILLPLVRAGQPAATVVYQTMDLHHVRYYREARLTGNRHALLQAMEMKRRELALARASDRTWVISGEERELLRQALPGARIDRIGMVFDSDRAGSAREGAASRDPHHAVFLGNFAHRPNVDAAQWLLEEIWPRVSEAVPQARLTVVGGNVPAFLHEGGQASVTWTGWIENLAVILDRAALGVAPLRFGAGIKGKIFSYVEHGLAPVLTSVAVEGLDLEHGQEALLADEAAAYAQALVRLMHAPDMARRLADAAGEKLAREYTREQLDRAIAASLNAVEIAQHARQG